MGGKIIEFRRRCDLERARLYRQQAVPRAPAGQPTPSRQFEQQIARISRLLGELEDLTRGPPHLPLAIVEQARASIEETSRILHQAKGEDDSQPDVDHRLLDRMYSALDLHAGAALPGSGSLGDGSGRWPFIDDP